MDNFADVWRWVERIAGIFMAVCFCLYLIRCISGEQIISFDQFDHFFRGLVAYIFK